MSASRPDIFESPLVPVLVQLENEGFTFRLLADGTVKFRPIAKLPADVRALFRAHPDELKLLVAITTDAGVHARRDVFRQQYEAAPAPTVPAFLFRDVPYVQGVCFSCGDPLPELGVGRCWRCSLAWRLACRLPIAVELAAALDAAKVA